MRTYKRFEKMIKKHLGLDGLGGEIVVSRNVGDPVYNPELDELVQEKVTQKGSAIRMSAKQKHFKDETVLSDDVNFYMQAEDINGCRMVTPNVLDEIEFAGSKYVVVTSSPWDFNGMLLGYKIHARVAS